MASGKKAKRIVEAENILKAYEADIKIRTEGQGKDEKVVAWVCDPGDVVLVNGRPWPVMTVQRRVYRFRVLNAALQGGATCVVPVIAVADSRLKPEVLTRNFCM